MNTRKAFILLAIIVLIGFCLRLSGALLFPLWGGPEEATTYTYAKFLAENGSLPIFENTLENLKSLNSLMVFQPPAYYAILAQFVNTVPAKFLRLANVVFGTLTILLTYLVAKEIGLDKKLGLFAAAFIALLPTHVIVSSSMINSPLGWLIGLTLSYYAIKVYKGKRAVDMLKVSALWVVAVFTKYTLLAFLPVLLVTAFVFLLKGKERISKKAGAVLFSLLSLAVFARNYVVWGSLIPSDPRNNPVILNNTILILAQLFSGIWLQEYGVATIPDQRYLFFIFCGITVLIAVIGLIKLAVKTKTISEKKKIVFFYVIIPIALNVVGILYMNLSAQVSDSRLLFETISLSAILLFVGLFEFWKTIKINPNIFSFGFLFFLLFWDLIVLLHYNTVIPKVPWRVF